jgi:hypothetical protein
VRLPIKLSRKGLTVYGDGGDVELVSVRSEELAAEIVSAYNLRHIPRPSTEHMFTRLRTIAEDVEQCVRGELASMALEVDRLRDALERAGRPPTVDRLRDALERAPPAGVEAEHEP